MNKSQKSVAQKMTCHRETLFSPQRGAEEQCFTILEDNDAFFSILTLSLLLFLSPKGINVKQTKQKQLKMKRF